MKKTMCLLIIFFFRLNVQAQYITLPDSNFVVWLQSAAPAAMAGNQMDTTNPTIVNMNLINVTGRNISDLTGITYFKSLQTLICVNNLLTFLPALPNSLKDLDCTNNLLASLPSLPQSLFLLSCDYNQLSSLPVLPNGLFSVDCSFNSLTGLPTLPDSLHGLLCGDNQITNLPVLPNALNSLNCSDNQITSLPTLPPNLSDFSCLNNNISCFPVFPNSIHVNYFFIDPNPYNCLPNYISAMTSSQLAIPICGAGNTNGCPDATILINHLEFNRTPLTIQPNPANNILTVEWEMQEVEIRIFDVLGNEIKKEKSSGRKQIDISNFNMGIYFIQVQCGNKVCTGKFVKE